jgi:D-xylose transport system permease protein
VSESSAQTTASQPPPGSHRAPVSTTGAPAITAAIPTTVGESVRSYRYRVRSGELGSLPAVLGIVLLIVIFGVLKPDLLHASSIGSLLQESAAPITLAMGLVFVLLLGEIDLSAGVVGAAASAFGVLWTARHGLPWYIAVIAAVVFGTAAGTLLGWLRARLGIPSFVVTLAAFISFQGIQIFLAGNSGGLSTQNQPVLVNLIYGNLSRVDGWIALVVFVAGFAVVKFYQREDRKKQGLAVESSTMFGIRIAAIAVGGAVFVYLCNLNELAPWQQARGLYQGGLPWLVPIIAVLGVILTFVLSKTRYGRHIYAVGGNTEAARRAGIPVRLIRTSVFSICSALAAISGLFAASQQNAATDNQGLGNTLLLGVAAAVVGGTSLAGGRGRVVDAILGGLALSILAFGMSDLLNSGNNTQYEDIITGVVLLIAAGVDATSRHAGRASS